MSSLQISRLVGEFISGVSPYDPLTYASVSAVLCAAALLACYVPARRGDAGRSDDCAALRVSARATMRLESCVSLRNA